MKNIAKKIIAPIRSVFTHALVEPSVLDRHIAKRIWHETNAFRWASAYLVKNQIKGDYAEFGVYKGASFIEMFNQIKDYSTTFYNHGAKPTGESNYFDNMKFHAFDSFEGLPPTNNKNNPIQYYPGAYSAPIEEFYRRLRAADVDLSRVTVTPGWFEDSLSESTAEALGLSNIAAAYIDCDVYESAINVLNFITPFLSTGSVLICDDWFRNRGNNSQGVQGAVLDWLTEYPNISLQHFHNSDTRTAVFIIRTQAAESSSKIDCV